MDDGSKDDTLERLKQFGDRIRVLKQANAGPAAARNAGVAAARGELITFPGFGRHLATKQDGASIELAAASRYVGTLLPEQYPDEMEFGGPDLV